MRKTTFFVPHCFKVQLRYKYFINKQVLTQNNPVLNGIKKALYYRAL